MKIISWNVNGIRSLLKTNYLDNLLIDEDPDILCISETKLGATIIDDIKLNNYKYKFWHNSKIKKGYSGTAILMKDEPLNIIFGLELNNKEYDNEGRLITLELPDYYLINVYTPNSGEGLNRLNERIKIWDHNFKKYINKLQKNKPIIICGDLNVAHSEIDLKNPKTNLKTAGYTIEERDSFNSILKNCNLLDSYRIINPDKIEYSYWSYMRNSRNKNIGWRIDYFLVDKKIQKKIKKSLIHTDILGSDHAPIQLTIT